MDIRKTVRLAMLLSLSIVLSIIESSLPFISSLVPGVKLGLTNVVVILVVYIYGFKEALFLSLMRVLLVSAIRTGLFNIIFFFSLNGALYSLIFMTLGKRFSPLSIVGVSILGSIAHAIGQIIIAIIFLNNINLLYYLPVLLVLSIPTGIIIGMIAKEVLRLYQPL